MDIIFLFNARRDSPDEQGIKFLYDIGVLSKRELPIIVPTVSYKSDPTLDSKDFEAYIKELKRGKFREHLKSSCQSVFDCSLGEVLKNDIHPDDTIRKFLNTPKTVEKIIQQSEAFVFVSERSYFDKNELIYDQEKQFSNVLKKGTQTKVEFVESKIQNASNLLLIFLLDVLSQNFSANKDLESVFNGWKTSVEKKKNTKIEQKEITKIHEKVEKMMKKEKVVYNSVERENKITQLRKEKLGDLLAHKLNLRRTFFIGKLKLKSGESQEMANAVIELLNERILQLNHFLEGLEPQNETSEYLNNTFLKFPSAIFSDTFDKGKALKNRIKDILQIQPKLEDAETEIKTILDPYPFPLANENRKRAQDFNGDFDELFKNRLNNKSKFRSAEFLRSSEFCQKSTLQSDGNLTVVYECEQEFNFFTVDYEKKKIHFEVKAGVKAHLKLIEETVDKFRFHFQEVETPGLYPIFIPSKVF
jgi:hypothetical protein